MCLCLDGIVTYQITSFWLKDQTVRAHTNEAPNNCGGKKATIFMAFQGQDRVTKSDGKIPPLVHVLNEYVL